MTFDEILERIAIDEHECWNFQGAHLASGYGSARFDGRVRVVHHVLWEAKNGPIPDGMQLDHLCRNRGCCNPSHIEVVTQRENLRRGISPTAINARKTRCEHGHEYTPENTYTSPAGWRGCRTCRTVNRRKHYLANIGTRIGTKENT